MPIAQKILDYNNSHLGKMFINGEIDSKGILKDKDKVKQHIGPRENYPMTINLNN